MRELSIYYCSVCGFYSYFQLRKNAVCPKCEKDMALLSMKYQDFMALNCEARDQLIAGLLTTPPSLTKRLTDLHKTHNTREIIGLLYQEIDTLEKENQKLSNTVEWMHDTIWDLLGKNKELERRLSEQRE